MWQLERRAWKDGLIARIEARAHGEPGAIVPEAQWPGWSAADDEFRRVRVTGAFLHDREFSSMGSWRSSAARPRKAITCSRRCACRTEPSSW